MLWVLPMTVHYSALTWHLVLEIVAHYYAFLVLQEQGHIGSAEPKTRRPAQAKPDCGNMLRALPMTVHYSDLTWHLVLEIVLHYYAFLVLQEQCHIGSAEFKKRRPAPAKPDYGNVLWALPMTVHYSDLTWHLVLEIVPHYHALLVLQKQRHIGSAGPKTRRPAQANPDYETVLWALPMTVHYSDLTWHLALEIVPRAHTGRKVLQEQRHIDSDE